MSEAGRARLHEALDALDMPHTRDWDDALNAMRCLTKQEMAGIPPPWAIDTPKVQPMSPVERNQPTMVVLRPGDKVLVALVDDPPPEEAQEWARQLHAAFKGVEFVIAGGVAALAVLGGGDRG